MKRKPRAGWLVAGGVALLCLAAIIVLWPAKPAPVEPAATPRVAPRPPQAIPALAAPARIELPTPDADEIPLMQPGSEDNAQQGPRRPHPIDATRLRIYRENTLIGTMNRAMDLGRHEELRKLNAQYRDEYPEDEHNLQRAYELIADCQEELTEERQAQARQFWKKYRSSQLRRFVRRHCRL